MGSIQADGPRRARLRPPRRVGAARRAREGAAARRRGGRRARRAVPGRGIRPLADARRRRADGARRPAVDERSPARACGSRALPRTRCASSRGSSPCSCPRRCTALRWTTLVVAVATFAVGRALAWWIGGDPRVLAALGTEAELRAVRREELRRVLLREPGGVVRGHGVDEQRLDRRAMRAPSASPACGCRGCIVQNAQNLGVTAARHVRLRRGRHLLPLHPPHGLLELTCVFVAARGRPAHLLGLGRARAAARAARRSPRTRGRSFSVAIGLVFALLRLGHHRGIRHAGSRGRGR